MKLYYYEHCPFCVRVRLVADINQLSYDKIILANDDEQSHYDLIGKKMVPILQKDNGECMAESLDICQYLDQKLGKHCFTKQPIDSTILESLDGLFTTAKKLLYPRLLYHPMNRLDFPTPSACEYFKHKKQSSLGISFDQALHESKSYRDTIQPGLDQLDKLLPNTDFIAGNQPSDHDIIVYPYLRTMTVARDMLRLPEKITRYLAHVSSLTEIELYSAYDFLSALNIQH